MRYFSLPRRPLCCQCRVNTHATKDCLELIARWEECNQQREVNLINVELWEPELALMSNVNIVTQGGKRTRADSRANKKPVLIKSASPKFSYESNQQKQYYKYVTNIFKQFILNSNQWGEQSELLKPKSPRLTQDISQPMMEWFKLFFQIMNDEKMSGKSRKGLRPTVKDKELLEGSSL